MLASDARNLTDTIFFLLEKLHISKIYTKLLNKQQTQELMQ